MFGFWFAVYGMFFGILCSFKAKEKNRHTKNWFTLGFVFGVFAYILLITLPEEYKSEETFSFNRN